MSRALLLLRAARRRSTPQTFVAYTTIVFVAAIVIYPILFLFAISLNTGVETDAREFFSDSMGLDNYAAIVENPTLVMNTLKVALIATAIAVPAGLFMAWVLFRTNIRGGRAWEQLLTVPYYVTPLVGALAWSILGTPASGFINQIWRYLGGSGVLLNIGSVWGIGLTMALFEGAVAFVMISAAMKSMDPGLEESAQISGAGKARIVRTITLPLLKPAIYGSTLFVFAEMLGAFAAPLILGSPERFYVITTSIYQSILSFPPDYPRAAALGLSLFAVLGLLMLIYSKLIRGGHFATVSGKAYRPRRVTVGGPTGLILSGAVSLYAFISVILPLLTLGMTSLQRVATSVLSNSEWTVKNYTAALSMDAVTSALKNSLVVGVATATTGTLLMGFLSWLIYRSDIPRTVGRTIEAVAMFPLAVPRIVFGLALLWAWLVVPIPIYGTLWLLWIAYLTVLLPLGVRTFGGVILQLDKSLEECAKVCGAGRIRQLRSVTMPLLKPGVIAVWILLFLASVRELGASIFLAGPDSRVIAPAIVQSWTSSGIEITAAMTIIQTLAVFIALVMLVRITSRSNYNLGRSRIKRN